MPFSPWLPKKHTHITPQERNSCHGPSALPGTFAVVKEGKVQESLPPEIHDVSRVIAWAADTALAFAVMGLWISIVFRAFFRPDG